MRKVQNAFECYLLGRKFRKCLEIKKKQPNSVFLSLQTHKHFLLQMCTRFSFFLLFAFFFFFFSYVYFVVRYYLQHVKVFRVKSNDDLKGIQSKIAKKNQRKMTPFFCSSTPNECRKSTELSSGLFCGYLASLKVEEDKKKQCSDVKTMKQFAQR